MQNDEVEAPSLTSLPPHATNTFALRSAIFQSCVHTHASFTYAHRLCRKHTFTSRNIRHRLQVHSPGHLTPRAPTHRRSASYEIGPWPIGLRSNPEASEEFSFACFHAGARRCEGRSEVGLEAHELSVHGRMGGERRWSGW